MTSGKAIIGGMLGRFLFRSARVEQVRDVSPHFRWMELVGEGLRDVAWSAGDKVQLKGAAADYMLVPGSIGGYSGMGIFYDSNHNHIWDSRDELIGHVFGSKTLAASDLFFI